MTLLKTDQLESAIAFVFRDLTMANLKTTFQQHNLLSMW